MKITLLLSTLFLLLVPRVMSSAQTVDDGNDLSLSVGSFCSNDAGYRQFFGALLGFTADKSIRRDGDSELALRVGWFHASESYTGWVPEESGDVQLDVIPVQLIKRSGRAYSSKSGSGFYSGYGAGFVVSRLRDEGTYLDEFDEPQDFNYSENHIDLSVTAMVGYRLGKTAFAELQWLFGNKESSGAVASIGARF